MGAAAAAWLALALGAAQATPARHFSDVCREPQSDDYAGREVTLDRGAQGWTVGYSATEGAVDEPTPARDVRYDPRSGRLSFEVKTWERLRFKGRIVGRVLKGEIAHDQRPPSRIALPEVGSAAAYPACR